MARAKTFLWLHVFSLLTFPVAARADYDPLTLFQMLMMADTVVSGEIVEVRSTTYDLAVRRAFRPRVAPPILTVQRIDSLPLASRWAAYAKGQELILFARSVASNEANLIPLGAAGEGEVPRDAEAVYLPVLPGLDRAPGSAQVAGAAVTGHRAGSAEFSEAVEGYFHCYAPREEMVADAKTRFESLCGDIELAEFRASSWLADYLAGIAERVIGKGN